MTQPFAHFSPLFRGRPSGCRSKAGRPNRPMTSHSGVAAPRPAGAPKRTRSACFSFWNCDLPLPFSQISPRAKARCSRRHQPTQDTDMGLFTKDIKTMDDLFLHTLQDIYYAENKIVKSLPDMIENASDAQLKQGSRPILARPRATSSGSSRCSRCWARSRSRSTARPSTASSRKPRRSPARSTTRMCSMPRSSPPAQAVEHYEITRYGIAHRLGQAAWPQRCGAGARAEPERGKSGRQEAHRHRREQGQSEGSRLSRRTVTVTATLCGGHRHRGEP